MASQFGRPKVVGTRRPVTASRAESAELALWSMISVALARLKLAVRYLNGQMSEGGRCEGQIPWGEGKEGLTVWISMLWSRSWASMAMSRDLNHSKER